LWVINHLFQIALGGGVGANFHGGGDGPGYTPIADVYGTVVEARPEYYGILMFTLAGQGILLDTSVSAPGLNVTAYAVHLANGRINIVIVNSDQKHNLTLSINCGQTVHSAELVVMTGPTLQATSGVEIQGATVAQDGSFAPSAPYTASISGSTVSCYLGALSAAVLTIY
jgi:alpha-L-arabinofuranosidase